MTRNELFEKVFAYFKRAYKYNPPSHKRLLELGLLGLDSDVGYNSSQFHLKFKQNAEDITEDSIKYGLLIPRQQNNQGYRTFCKMGLIFPCRDSNGKIEGFIGINPNGDIEKVGEGSYTLLENFIERKQEETTQSENSIYIVDAPTQTIPDKPSLSQTSKASFIKKSNNEFVYTDNQVSYTILGGIRMDEFDRLKATLKIECIEKPHIAIRHNLDLYNQNQVDKLIRNIAERFSIGITYISSALMALVGELEQLRLEHQNIEIESKVTLTESQRNEAVAFLSAPNLIHRTNELIGKSGVMGEEINRLLMYLIFTSRKRDNPLHVVSLASSATGKSYLQEKIGELIPDEEKLEVTTLSDNAFYYFGQRELKNKLLLIEDLDGVGVLYPLRELQSKKRLSKTLTTKDADGKLCTTTVVVEGPLSIAGCTTRESIYEDNANRSFLLYLDDSKEQDNRIMDYQRKLSAGLVDVTTEYTIKAFLKDVQRVLEPVRVVNPFAMELIIPDEVFKPRRTNAHYLQFIEAVTFYKQYQREHKKHPTTGECYIETTLEDIAEANELLKEVLLRKSDTLTGACRGYFERLKSYLEKEKLETFTSRDMVLTFKSLGYSTIRRYHQELAESGLIKRINIKPKVGESSKNLPNTYAITGHADFNCLKQKVTNSLECILEQIKLKQSPQACL